MENRFKRNIEIFLFCKSISTLTGADVYNVELFCSLIKNGYKANLVFSEINENRIFNSNIEYIESRIRDCFIVSKESVYLTPFLGSINDFFKHKKLNDFFSADSIGVFSNNQVISVVLNGIKISGFYSENTYKIKKIYQIIHHEFYEEEKPHPSILPENLFSCRPMPHYKSHYIGNPIDVSFFPKPSALYNYRLRNIVNMIGSIDIFRFPFLSKLSKLYQGKGLEFISIGRNDYPEIPGVLYLEPSIKNIPSLYNRSLLTLGVFNGRTKLESFSCGIPYCNFDIENPNSTPVIEFPPFFSIPDQEIPITELKNINLLKYFNKDSYDKFIHSISSDFVVESLISYIVKNN